MAFSEVFLPFVENRTQRVDKQNAKWETRGQPKAKQKPTRVVDPKGSISYKVSENSVYIRRRPNQVFSFRIIIYSVSSQTSLPKYYMHGSYLHKNLGPVFSTEFPRSLNCISNMTKISDVSLKYLRRGLKYRSDIQSRKV